MKTLTLSNEEWAALIAIVDLAVKSAGIGVVHQASSLLQKMSDAEKVELAQKVPLELANEDMTIRPATEPGYIKRLTDPRDELDEKNSH